MSCPRRQPLEASEPQFPRCETSLVRGEGKINEQPLWIVFPHFLNFNLISSFLTWICAHYIRFRCGFQVSPCTLGIEGPGSACFGGLFSTCTDSALGAPSVGTAPNTEGQIEGRGRAGRDPRVQ